MGLSGSCFAVYARAAFCPVCSHGFKVYRQAGKTVGRISGVVHSAHNRENALASGDCHRLGNTLGTPVIHGDRNPLSIHLRHPPKGFTGRANQQYSSVAWEQDRIFPNILLLFRLRAGNPPGNFAFDPQNAAALLHEMIGPKHNFILAAGYHTFASSRAVFEGSSRQFKFLKLPVLYHF